jgi:hypothetical protein
VPTPKIVLQQSLRRKGRGPALGKFRSWQPHTRQIFPTVWRQAMIR